MRSRIATIDLEDMEAPRELGLVGDMRVEGFDLGRGMQALPVGKVERRRLIVVEDRYAHHLCRLTLVPLGRPTRAAEDRPAVRLPASDFRGPARPAPRRLGLTGMQASAYLRPGSVGDLRIEPKRCKQTRDRRPGIVGK